jgi:hypothetical protein
MMSQSIRSNALFVADLTSKVFRYCPEGPPIFFQMSLLEMTIELPLRFEAAFAFITLVALGFFNFGHC